MSTPEELVDGFLYEADEERNTRACSVCRNKELRAAIAYFYEKKTAGETLLTLGWFYEKKLQAEFGGPPSRTVRDHVRRCMRLDVKTGQPL